MQEMMVFCSAREKERAEKQQKIRHMLRQGRTAQEIALKIGVSGETVRAVRRGTARAPKQMDAAPVVTLFDQGRAPSAIAEDLRMSYGKVVFMLQETGRKVRRQHHVNRPCPYASDCFHCPLPDCYIDGNIAARVNRLETDFTKEYT